MSGTMQFDLVSPERRLASVQASEVQLPGADGDLTVMPQHAPTITTLRPGILAVSGPDSSTEYVVTGGFAEITETGTTVLAEQAFDKVQMTQAEMETLVSDARAAHEAASGEMADSLAKTLADLEMVASQIA